MFLHPQLAKDSHGYQERLSEWLVGGESQRDSVEALSNSTVGHSENDFVIKRD